MMSSPMIPVTIEVTPVGHKAAFFFPDTPGGVLPGDALSPQGLPLLCEVLEDLPCLGEPRTNTSGFTADYDGKWSDIQDMVLAELDAFDFEATVVINDDFGARVIAVINAAQPSLHVTLTRDNAGRLPKDSAALLDTLEVVLRSLGNVPKRIVRGEDGCEAYWGLDILWNTALQAAVEDRLRRAKFDVNFYGDLPEELGGSSGQPSAT